MNLNNNNNNTDLIALVMLVDSLLPFLLYQPPKLGNQGEYNLFT